jgi:hypothetical protein
MKRVFSALFFLLSFTLVASAQTTEKKAEAKEAAQVRTEAPAEKVGPKLEFETEQVDFGTIAQDSEPFRTIKIKNVGDTPLLITNARGSCGCTVPTVPKKPIAPGESAEMKVRYDTKRLGAINKTVTLTTNEKNPTKTIRVVGQIEPKPEGTPAKESNLFNNTKKN